MINIKVFLFIVCYIVLSTELLMSYNLCKNYKKISYDEIVKNKNNIDKIVYSSYNNKIYLKLKNNTEFNYYNSKGTDILGIAHIYLLFSNK